MRASRRISWSFHRPLRRRPAPAARPMRRVARREGLPPFRPPPAPPPPPRPPPPLNRAETIYKLGRAKETVSRQRVMTESFPWNPDLTRRASLRFLAAAAAAIGTSAEADAASFAQWMESFRSRARARGVSDATYTRVMGSLKPDTRVYTLYTSQPEFTEPLGQYLNRRVSDWRVTEGRVKAKEYVALLSRVEHDFGVPPPVMLGIWGVESAYGDPDVQKNHMRPIFPALAALAWGEPRRRAYWEQELLNALVIVERGWGTPEEMRGSWAGAMGHTQWMPEVWLNMGMDYDRDGRVSPFGRPDDALASTARYLAERGKYRRGEHWGYEVRVASGVRGGSRSYDAWRKAGVVRADGQ